MPIASKLAHQHQAMQLNQSAKKISRQALFSKDGGLGSSKNVPLPKKREKEMKLPVNVQIASKKVQSHTLRGKSLGDDSPAMSVDTSEPVVVVTEAPVEVIESTEEYVVTDAAPVLSEEQVADVQDFAATVDNVSTPTKGILEQLWDWIKESAAQSAEEALKTSIKDLKNESANVVNNTRTFFLDRFLKACEVRLTASEEFLDISPSVVIDKSLSDLASSQASSSSVVRALTAAAVIGRSTTTGLSKDYTAEKEVNVVVNTRIFSDFAPIPEAISNSFLCALGAKLLGLDTKVFGSGSEIYNPKSDVAQKYRSCVLYGAMLVSNMNKMPEGKDLLKEIVQDISVSLCEVLSCSEEMLTSLDGLTKNTIITDANFLLNDQIAEVLFEGLAVPPEEVVQQIQEGICAKLESSLLTCLSLYALGAEAQLLSVVDLVSNAVNSLKNIRRIVPAVEDQIAVVEEKQNSLMESTDLLRVASNISDDSLLAFNVFLDDPAGFIIAQSGNEEKAIVAEIVDNIFKTASGSATKDIGYGSVLQYSAKPEFVEQVRAEVVKELQKAADVAESEEKTVAKDSAALRDTLKVVATEIAAVDTATISTEDKAQVDEAQASVVALQDAADTIRENAARLRTQTVENVAAALKAGKKQVALSAMGSGTKVAIGAAILGGLFLGARMILKKK